MQRFMGYDLICCEDDGVIEMRYIFINALKFINSSVLCKLWGGRGGREGNLGI